MPIFQSSYSDVLRVERETKEDKGENEEKWIKGWMDGTTADGAQTVTQQPKNTMNTHSYQEPDANISTDPVPVVTVVTISCCRFV